MQDIDPNLMHVRRAKQGNSNNGRFYGEKNKSNKPTRRRHGLKMKNMKKKSQQL